MKFELGMRGNTAVLPEKSMEFVGNTAYPESPLVPRDACANIVSASKAHRKAVQNSVLLRENTGLRVCASGSRALLQSKPCLAHRKAVQKLCSASREHVLLRRTAFPTDAHSVCFLRQRPRILSPHITLE